MRKFPKNIFQVWYQGCNKIQKEEFKINMDNWKKSNNGWNYYCIDDKTMEKACLKFSKRCHDAYKMSKIMHIKIDLARYVLIYLYGGMYVDIDAYLLRSLNDSKHIKDLIYKYEVENKNIIGISICKTNILESYLYVGHNNIYNNGIMFSSPNNPTMKRFIDYIIDEINKYKDSILVENYIVTNSTGPNVLNRFFRKKENIIDTDIFLFSPTIFEPCDIGQQCEITKDTISIHLFESSWIPKYLKVLLRFYIIFRPMFIPLIIILIILFFYIKRKRI